MSVLNPTRDRPPAPADDPDEILAVYLRAPGVHAYGIADVAQLWERSRWWRRGDAVIGLLDLPGSHAPVAYAVAAAADAATLDLLERLAPHLPDRFVVTGPRGLTGRLARTHDADWSGPYRKLHLADPGALPPADPAVEVLGRADAAALEALYATDPDAGGFFHAGLLDIGPYLGRREGGELVAAAGVHVVERRHGVAAIGNVATHPAHRGRGLGRAVVGALCHRLLAEVDVVALNVGEGNAPACALYARLGFVSVADYEEAELVRR